ncbi:nitroreductase family protein [Clostridiaceae bacterium 35-E11]
MKFSKLVEDMRTIRDYKKEPVNPQIIQEIIDIGKNSQGFVQGRNLSIVFIDNGKEIFEQLSGKAGYFGKMIEAPHYLAITSKVFPGYIENSGYIMESMRLKAWELGLGTCWLNIQDEEALKELLKIESDDKLTAFVAIGHQYKGIFKKDISPKSDRIGIDKLIYLNRWESPCPIEELENRGFANVFYYAKFAPSWGNRQPWRFMIDKDKVLLIVPDQEEASMKLDAGIMMLYFEKAAHEEGIQGNWKMTMGDVEKSTYGIPSGYQLKGYFAV